VDYYADPKRAWSMFMGSAIHSRFEQHSDAVGILSEVELSMPLEVPLTVNGESRVYTFPIVGTLDSYDPEHRRLIDFKTTSREFWYTDAETGKRKKRELPEEAHVVQANIYRMLLEYHGYPVDEIRIWYVRTVPNAPREFVEVPIWDDDEIYLTAVALATPLVRARELGELPPCTCRYRSGLDPDLCNEIEEVDFSRVREYVSVLPKAA